MYHRGGDTGLGYDKIAAWNHVKMTMLWKTSHPKAAMIPMMCVSTKSKGDNSTSTRLDRIKLSIFRLYSLIFIIRISIQPVQLKNKRNGGNFPHPGYSTCRQLSHYRKPPVSTSVVGTLNRNLFAKCESRKAKNRSSHQGVGFYL